MSEFRGIGTLHWVQYFLHLFEKHPDGLDRLIPKLSPGRATVRNLYLELSQIETDLSVLQRQFLRSFQCRGGWSLLPFFWFHLDAGNGV